MLKAIYLFLIVQLAAPFLKRGGPAEITRSNGSSIWTTADVPDFGMAAATVMAIVISRRRSATKSALYPKDQVNMDIIGF